jgi:energy-coupling factor transporter ATP-binding protein EcfA2
MIRLQRPEPPPAWGDRAGTANQAVSKTNVQTRYTFDERLIHDESVVGVLRAANGRRCAFCEAPDGTPAPVNIDRFRPAQEATDLDGTPYREHYHWLVFEWDNLVPVCGFCTSSRGRRFPVEGRRAQVFATGADLQRERRLLLDPFAEDPELELTYDNQYNVVGMTPRGETSIGVLNLNRPQLIADRGVAALAVGAVLQELLATPRPTLQSIVEASIGEHVDGSKPYTGIRRHTIRVALIETPLAQLLYGDIDPADAAARLNVGGPAFDLVRRIRRPQPRMAEGPPSDESISVSSSVRAKPPELGAVRLEKIEIADMKAIESLELSLPPPMPDREPWLLLLGENGVGKSTVLKLLALASMQPDERRRRVPDASVWVRRGAKVRRGTARLTFSDGQVLNLTARTGSKEFSVTGSAPTQVVLGYGPTRLPPNPQHQPASGTGLHVDNLFDPWVPLDDVEGWLSDTRRVPTDDFNLHCTDLRMLLPFDPEDLLVRRLGRLYAKVNGVTVPLAELSDGFRSVIALATDMMLHLSADSTSMKTAAGLVLIDELEVHLHPQWKLTIVGLLRRVFPQVRFIVSTHDPLCLQNTDPGEVFVLMRDEDERVMVHQADVPKGLRADQLLTGEWFGLSTTVDDDTAELVASHGALLLQPQTPDVQIQRAVLEEQIRGRLGHFAETSPERMAQSIAAQLLNERDIRELSADERAKLRTDVLAAVRERESAVPA